MSRRWVMGNIWLWNNYVGGARGRVLTTHKLLLIGAG